jgi:hypothetical protein
MRRSAGRRSASVETPLWSAGRPVPVPVARALETPGRPLADAPGWDARWPGHDFSRVRIHADERAADAAMVLNARAFTVGSDIVFGPGQYEPGSTRGRELLSHELGHVRQAEGRSRSSGGIEVAESADRERHASRSAGGPHRVGPNVLQRHPAEKVLKFAGRWLTKKTTKQLTKHIAKHTRTIAGKAVHSVFRNPRAVRYTVTRAVREATELVERHATTAVTHMVEEGAIRVSRQATRSPGKYRWVVEKTFTEAIGTAGERILRIVIDQTGRIVTAFPSDRLVALGLTTAGIEAFTARTAEAAETVSASVEWQTALETAASEPPDTGWWEWLPIVGDLAGGELNSGESEWLAARDEAARRDKMVREVVTAAVGDIEADLQTSLGPERLAEVEEFVRMVIASGVDVSTEE